MSSDALPTKCPVLKTADQYDVWKARVADACWSATGKDIFSLTDEACQFGIAALEEKAVDKKDKKAVDWLGKCWLIVTGSLHDDLYRKVSHVPRGQLRVLLNEICHALVVNNLDEVQPLRLELYGASMVKDCNSDLQAWINYVMERANKLSFLKKGVQEEELVAIFLKGLHPVIFQQLQVFFAIPGQLPKEFDKAVAITRKFAQNPAVAAELAKLKSSGMSQSMFPVVHHAPKSKQPLCKLFASSGTCRYGTRCRFVHTATPASSPPATPVQSNSQRPKCDFCQRWGHNADVCNLKQRLLAQLQPQAALASVSVQSVASPAPESLQSTSTTEDKVSTSTSFDATHYSFVFTATTSGSIPRWVMDSGATCCATFNEADCIDIHDCKIQVTAAGSTFTVFRAGTAIISALNEQGRAVELRMRNTLISPKFPYKLLALQLFTAKGLSIIMCNDRMRISNPVTDCVFIGMKDPKTQLFFLQEAALPSVSSGAGRAHTYLARSYGGGKGK